MTECLIRVGIDLHTWECAVQDEVRVSSVLFVGDHGGSTLLPRRHEYEFPEYGTMEGSGEGLRASLEFDAESLLRLGSPQGAALPTILWACHCHRRTKNIRGLPSQSHFKEPSLQPIDSLISALKATEARIASGTSQATKVLDGAAVSTFQLSLGRAGARHRQSRSTEGARCSLLAAKRNRLIYLFQPKFRLRNIFAVSIQEDLTALLTGETQAEPSKS